MRIRIVLLTLLLTLGLALAQGVAIEHSAGTTELPEPATRVVALEWTYVEDLLAVGVEPVGVADIAGYRQWVDVEPELSEEAVEVGTRQEPSLESILALEPDLIIGVEYRHAPILDQLQAIAPTLLFNPYPGPEGQSQLQEMEETFRAIATAVDRSEEAEDVLSQMQDSFSDARGQLTSADQAGLEVLLVQAFSYQNAPQIRVFTDNAMAMGIVEEIGLQNAWAGEYSEFGFDTIDVEGLARVSDADAFFYVVQEDDDVFAERLATNPLWSNLGFVQAERTYPLGGDTWLFGGPLSAQLVAEKVSQLLTE